MEEKKMIMRSGKNKQSLDNDEEIKEDVSISECGHISLVKIMEEIRVD